MPRVYFDDASFGIDIPDSFCQPGSTIEARRSPAENRGYTSEDRKRISMMLCIMIVDAEGREVLCVNGILQIDPIGMRYTAGITRHAPSWWPDSDVCLPTSRERLKEIQDEGEVCPVLTVESMMPKARANGWLPIEEREKNCPCVFCSGRKIARLDEYSVGDEIKDVTSDYNLMKREIHVRVDRSEQSVKDYGTPS